jgi:hypothetical protein
MPDLDNLPDRDPFDPFDHPWPDPVEVTGYTSGPVWFDAAGRPMPHVQLRTDAGPWPLVLSVTEVAAALRCADTAIGPDTDLDDLACLAVRGIARRGWHAVAALELGTADTLARVTCGQGDWEDELYLIESWGGEPGFRACEQAAAALCEHAPDGLRRLPGTGHSPTLAELADTPGVTAALLEQLRTDQREYPGDRFGDRGDRGDQPGGLGEVA